MENYIDIKLKPVPELQESPLMNIVFTRLHNKIIEMKTEQIGVSFPEYKIKLGRILRLHGSEKSLQNFIDTSWLDEVAEYCEVVGVNNIPSEVKYRVISRIRPNMSKSKLERLKRRNAINTDAEKEYKKKMFAQGLDNPFVDLDSGSTGQRYRLFINLGELLEHPIEGKYNSYGLSKEATVPWF